jgi:quercetin dioxygenase-like cupin family protein
MKTNTNNHFDIELEKAKAHIIVEILEYVPNSVLTRTIIKKTTGNITVSAVDEGEELAEKTLAYDSFLQVIDGAADVTIKGEKVKLTLGEAIVIPAHSSHCIAATEQFKIISTIIKSGYED